MNNQPSIEEVMHWRLMRAEEEAPPAPRAICLLKMARPWWETWPEHCQLLAERLRGLQVAYGLAMTNPRQSRTGYPVPALIVQEGKEFEAFARVLYFSIREGRLRLRFRLESTEGVPPEAGEVTFLSEKTGQPLFTASATLAVDSEYKMDAELPAEFARDWEPLKVTDRMPFHLILRTNLMSGS